MKGDPSASSIASGVGSWSPALRSIQPSYGVLDAPLFFHRPPHAAGQRAAGETAATMLKVFGIRCVIAPSFGLIFHDNCFRNHMLPLVLDWETVQRLGRQAATGGTFTLDLRNCTLTPPDSKPISFTLPSFRREMLLTGADDLEVTLGREAEISAYQALARQQRPWEWLDREAKR